MNSLDYRLKHGKQEFDKEWKEILERAPPSLTSAFKTDEPKKKHFTRYSMKPDQVD